ncbi:hypothetical protein OIU76_024695 [Salix suchowensis]|nr:hypothetical protein OIU76_024695 [Salix suchowensis]
MVLGCKEGLTFGLWAVLQGGGAGFQPWWCGWLPNKSGFYGRMAGFILGFKFWIMVDFYGRISG